jgi:glycosyltransferase involved in cell wall biosynthesis
MKNKVSVVTVAYDQENILSECIEGVLKQDLTLIKEYIIADDASTDNTRKIIERYSTKYPNLIKPIFRKKNLGTRGNILDCWKRCIGKYIATCAGDDIWIDKKYITKQVQILDKNEDYFLVGTNGIIWDVDSNEYSLKDIPLPNKVLSPLDYLIGGPIIGSNYMWRNNLSEELFEVYKNHGDTRFFMYLAYKGAFYDRRSISTIYRASKSGAFFKKNNSTKKIINNYIAKIYRNNKFDTYSDGQYENEIISKNNLLIRKIIKNYLRTGKFFNALVFFHRYDYSISNSRKKRFLFKILKLFLNLFDAFLIKAYDKKFNKIIKFHNL